MRVIATITKERGTFLRWNYRVSLKNGDGSAFYRPMQYRRVDGSLSEAIYSPDGRDFSGNDGRRVRTAAIAWAKQFAHEIIQEGVQTNDT